MTKILALETATEACSAALLIDGEINERFEIAPRRHTDIILPMVAELLADAGLAAQNIDAIAFGAGPGSFTGVRVATSVAQGMALAHDLPVVPLSCLAILALGGARAHDCASVAAVMDARRQEIYFAVYAVDQATQVSTCLEPDAIGAPQDVRFPTGAKCIVVGAGMHVYREQFANMCEPNVTLMDNPLYPRARDGLMQALDAFKSNATVAAEFAEPVYLRRAV